MTDWLYKLWMFNFLLLLLNYELSWIRQFKSVLSEGLRVVCNFRRVFLFSQTNSSIEICSGMSWCFCTVSSLSSVKPKRHFSLISLNAVKVPGFHGFRLIWHLFWRLLVMSSNFFMSVYVVHSVGWIFLHLFLVLMVLIMGVKSDLMYRLGSILPYMSVFL